MPQLPPNWTESDRIQWSQFVFQVLKDWQEQHPGDSSIRLYVDFDRLWGTEKATLVNLAAQIINRWLAEAPATPQSPQDKLCNTLAFYVESHTSAAAWDDSFQRQLVRDLIENIDKTLEQTLPRITVTPSCALGGTGN
jgi:hypothetical protein